MPTFVRPVMAGPSYTATVACPVCGVEATGDREVSTPRAKASAVRGLQFACTCEPEPRFVVDDTPEGVTLWADGLGGLRRCYLHGADVLAEHVGPVSPGSLPLIVCVGELEAFDPREKKRQVRFAPTAAEAVSSRFRRKGFRVQLAVGKPTALHGDPLPPIFPERKSKKKEVKK